MTFNDVVHLMYSPFELNVFNIRQDEIGLNFQNSVSVIIKAIVNTY